MGSRRVVKPGACLVIVLSFFLKFLLSLCCFICNYI